MKILVTGATGFIGSHLCESLLKEKHSLFALVRNEEKFYEQNIKATPIKGAISHKSNHNWIKLLPQDLDIVIHTAGITHSFDNKKFYDFNAKATEKFIEDLAKRYSKLKFIMLSSLAVAGPSQLGQEVSEKTIPAPVSHYGHSKYLGEIALLESPQTVDWRKIIIRPPMVLGPKDEAGVDLFKMAKQKLFLIAGLKGKLKEYSFICVHDLVDVITRSTVARGFEQTEILNPSHPHIVTYNDIIKTLKEITKTQDAYTISVPIPILWIIAYSIKLIHAIFPKINFRLTPDKISEFSPEAWTCTPEKTQILLQKTFDYDLKKTLEITYLDYKTRGLI